jgi:alpha-D-ribose 1-methylphosphonate 5-triphosphate synthase subunit PhnG
MTSTPENLPGWSHDALLSVLARAEAARLKGFAERLIDELPAVAALENRTGLVMLPMRDTAQGTHFHLGEVLMSEARITAGGQEGYGMRRGRDLEAAMAVALVDLAVALGVAQSACASFVQAEAKAQTEADREALRRVEATRVDMETF